MDIDEMKNSAGMLSDLVISKENIDYISIEDHVFAMFGIEKNTIEKTEILFKNHEKLALKYQILIMANNLPLNDDTKDVLPPKTDLKLGYKRMKNLAIMEASYE